MKKSACLHVALAASACLFPIQSLHAETLPVRGVYPAMSDEAAALGSIAIESFGGVDGQAIGIAASDMLRAVRIEGEPWFRIVPASARADADAILQGTANSESFRRDSGTREVDRCVERDEDRNCIREEKRKIPCWDAVVRLDPRIRLVTVDGRLIYAVDDSREVARRFCEGDDRPSRENMLSELVEGLALQIRFDLAPLERLEDIRVMESRAGLQGDDRDAFRDAVRLTKTDRAGACDAWAALEPANPENVSVLFNLGLCAESEGDLGVAEELYRRALMSDTRANYPTQGMSRLEARYRAEAQMDAHYGN